MDKLWEVERGKVYEILRQCLHVLDWMGAKEFAWRDDMLDHEEEER